jgi:dCTP deaminase
MILSDREIFLAMKRGLINIDPCPPLGSNLWTPTTLDLRLHSEIRPWEEIAGIDVENPVDPEAETFSSTTFATEFTKPHDCTRGFVIRPQGFVLGWTIEEIQLPKESRIAARVEGKSSLARIGLGIHVTAPTIHPGFGVNLKSKRGSPIRLEIWNCGTLPIKLTKGMAICQIIFEEVHGTPVHGYTGQFRMQGPEPVKKPKKSGK